MAEARAATTLAAAEAQAASAREVADATEQARTQFAAREKERQEMEAEARSRLAEDREELRKMMERGPEQGGVDVAQTIGEMAAEALRASIRRDVPNFAPALDRAMKRNRQRFEQRAKDAMAGIESTGDDVQDALNMRRELVAQEQAGRVAILERAEGELTARLARTRVPLERANLATTVSQVRQQREAAEAQAAQARIEAEDKRRKGAAELRLTEARTAKELAAARKGEAEALRAEKRAFGAGRKRATGAGLIPETVITVPGTDQTLVKFPDTKEGRKEAKVTREILAKQSLALETINHVMAKYEDAEKQGLLGSLGVEGSKVNEDLTQALSDLEKTLATAKAGIGFAVSDADNTWAKQQVPANPKLWSSKERGMRRLKAMRQSIETETRSRLEGHTRLDAATRERILKKARSRAVSETQRARELASRATQILVDPKAEPEARIAAIKNVEENARKRAKEQKGDWLEIAATELLGAKVDNPEVNKARVTRLKKYGRMLAAREKAARRQEGRTTGTGFSYFYTPEKREQLASEADRYRNLQDKITEALE